MARQHKAPEQENEAIGQVEKPAYQINPRVKSNGFVANYFRFGGPLIVINKDTYVDNIDPTTGQIGKTIGFESSVFIDGIKRETYDIPGDLPMRVIYSLGQAKVILCNPEQAKEYNAYGKSVANGGKK